MSSQPTTGREGVVATETVIVHDDVLGIDRRVIAGQPVPPDLIDAYADEVGLERAAADPGDPAATQNEDDLDSKSVEDLEALAKDRGVKVSGTGKDGRVVKGDYLTALRGQTA